MDLTVKTGRHGSSLRLILAGEIDARSRGILHDAVLAALTDDGVAAIVLDLADLTVIDSTGMATIVACHRAAAVSGRSMRVEHVAPLVRREFYAAGLLGLLGIVDDRPAPIASS
jgi:anti-anti-sigma factor